MRAGCGRSLEQHCGQVLHWRSENSPRLLQVNWGDQQATRYPVQLLVRAFDRRDLIRDISTVLSSLEIQVTDISSRLDESRDEVTIRGVRISGILLADDVARFEVGPATEK